MLVREVLVAWCLLCWIHHELHGQVVIASQGFENSASDTWAFTPPFQNLSAPQVVVGSGAYGALYAKTGSRSMRIGGGSTTCGNGSGNCVATGSPSTGGSCTANANGTTLTLAVVDIRCYTAVSISLFHRPHILCTSQGQGFDTSDQIRFEASINGGPYFTTDVYSGNNNCIWDYTAGLVSCMTNIPNPYVYSVPAGTNTIAFRIGITVNRSDEVLYLDDIIMRGTPIPIATSGIFHD